MHDLRTEGVRHVAPSSCEGHALITVITFANCVCCLSALRDEELTTEPVGRERIGILTLGLGAFAKPAWLQRKCAPNKRLTLRWQLCVLCPLPCAGERSMHKSTPASTHFPIWSWAS